MTDMPRAPADAAPEPAPRQLSLELPGRTVPVLVRRRTDEASLHTGRALEVLHGWITTTDAETHAWLSAALRRLGDRGVRACDPDGEFAGKWQLSWNAYGENGSQHTYTVILREHEELSLDALVLDGVELHPYEYRETIAGGGVVIWAKVVGAEEDVLDLRARLRDRGHFPVIRAGIQDEPREMRLGLAEWSDFEDRVKYRLVLVERGVEAGAHRELLRMERENARAALGFYMNFAERLVDLLLERQVVSPREIDAARDAAASAPGVVRHDFWRVGADIDDL